MASNILNTNLPIVSGNYFELIISIYTFQKQSNLIVRGSEGVYLLNPIDNDYSKIAKFNDFQ